MNRENLLAEVLDDLNRSDMTTAASSAISSAISLYEKERWYFLEGNAVITSSASQVYYDLPSDLLDPDSVLVTISGAKQPLRRLNFLDIDAKDTRQHTGEPAEYCLYQNQIRFYPIASTTTYNLTLSYHKVLETTASASNAWTNVAKDLIRHAAVKEVALSKLFDPEGAARAEKKESEAYEKLTGLNTARVTTGRIGKTDW